MTSRTVVNDDDENDDNADKMSPLFLFPSSQFPNGSSMDPQHSKWYHPFIFRISQHFKHVELLIISWPSWPSRHMRTWPIYASYLLSMPIICQKSNISPFKYNILPLYMVIRLLSICTRIAQKITWMSFLIVNLVQKTEIFSTFSKFSPPRFQLSNQQQWWKKVEVKAINHHIIEQVHNVGASFCFPL